MSPQLRRIIPAFVGLAVAATFLVWSHAYDGRAHTIPMLIGWTAVVLALIDMVAQTETGVGRTLHEILSGQPLDNSSTETDQSARSAVIPALWVASFVGVVAIIGFIAAIPIYTIAFMRLQGRMPWRKTAIGAIAITAVTWIVFEQLLRYKVFEGWVFGGQF